MALSIVVPNINFFLNFLCSISQRETEKTFDHPHQRLIVPKRNHERKKINRIANQFIKTDVIPQHEVITKGKKYTMSEQKVREKIVTTITENNEKRGIMFW